MFSAIFLHISQSQYSPGTSEFEKWAFCNSTDLSACWPFATAITHVGLLSGVLADVSDEWAGLGEGLATDRADTGLLSCRTWFTVSPWRDVDNICVGFQMDAFTFQSLPECTCVDAFMPLQSSRVTESSLAVHTGVRFLPTVDSQVSLQIS